MRGLTPRDAILVLLGAACMHIASVLIGFSEPSSIVVNTHVTSHTGSSDLTQDDIFELLHPAPLELPDVNAQTDSEYSPPHSLAAPISPDTESSISSSSQSFVALDVETEIPETTIISHAPGWTIFRNLYMSDGTLFIVSSTPEAFPSIALMTSTGLPAENTPESIEARMPTDRDMKIISPTEARERWGADWTVAGEKNRLSPIAGSTLLFNDPSQFIDHYYHFCAELWFGVQAFWTGAFNARITLPLSTSADSYVHSTAPPLSRAIFAHTRASEWRDKPGFNAYFLRAAFPSLTVETAEDWEDRITVTKSKAKGQRERAWWFDTVMLTDRSAAFRGEECGIKTQRTAAEAILGVKDTLDRHWWEPVRRAVLRFAGIDASVLSIGDRQDERKAEGLGQDRVVVSYIDRQGSRRHLIQEDHEGLVTALEEVCQRRGWELNIVQAEKLSKEEQLEVAAKTTFMLGVHGNGLTHLIMMPVTPISTVIEIFYPEGFAHDYEWTARARGMKHFAVWNDTFATYPDPRVANPAYPEGFQGTQIPVHGPTVARLLEERYDGVW